LLVAAPKLLEGLSGAGGAGGGGGGGGSGAGELVNQIVPLTDGISHIMDTIRDQQNKAKEQARNNDNEFNIRTFVQSQIRPKLHLVDLRASSADNKAL